MGQPEREHEVRTTHVTPDGLTQAELAAVLRRAAQLDAEGPLPVPSDRLDPAVVEAAAIEAGLSPASVRRAMAEVLHPDESLALYQERGLLPARQLVFVREVPGAVDEVEEQVDRFLRRQLFERRRLFADGSKWAPRSGWGANIKRGLDPGGRLALKQVRSVEVTLSAVQPSSAAATSSDTAEDAPEVAAPSVLVRLIVDISKVRSIHSAWLAGGAAGGGAVIGATGLAVGLDPLSILALPAAGGLTVGGHYIGRHGASKEADTIHTGVAGFLDRLEHDRG